MNKEGSDRQNGYIGERVSVCVSAHVYSWIFLTLCQNRLDLLMTASFINVYCIYKFLAIFVSSQQYL